MAEKYHISQKVFHWVMALIIIFMIILGFFMHDFPKEIKFFYYGIHKSFGVIVLALFVFRVLLRKKYGAPDLPKKFKKWEFQLSHVVHYSLYLLMFLMPISGWVMSNAKGYGVKLFSIEMPDLVTKNKAIGDFAHSAHSIIAWVLVAVLVLHVIGVIKHLVIDKENILKRMV